MKKTKPKNKLGGMQALPPSCFIQSLPNLQSSIIAHYGHLRQRCRLEFHAGLHLLYNCIRDELDEVKKEVQYKEVAEEV